MNRPALGLTSLLSIAALLGGCAGDTGDLDRFIQETKQRHRGKVDPLPEFPPYQTFAYDASRVRDPFRPQTDLNASPVSAEIESTGPRPEASRRREILERFPIDSLKMVGLLQQQSQTWGLVRDPDGTIHRVQPGSYAGQNHGKIVSVSENRIDIVELVPDGLSGWVNRDAKLAMSDE